MPCSAGERITHGVPWTNSFVRAKGVDMNIKGLRLVSTSMIPVMCILQISRCHQFQSLNGKRARTNKFVHGTRPES